MSVHPNLRMNRHIVRSMKRRCQGCIYVWIFNYTWRNIGSISAIFTVHKLRKHINFRIELTVNVNTLFHGDGQAWKAGDLRLSGSKNFFLAREKKSCREKYLERCWLKRAGALTLTVNSMRMWITSRLIFASKAPSPAKVSSNILSPTSPLLHLSRYFFSVMLLKIFLLKLFLLYNI